MSRWYRAYEGTVSDPKLGEVALIAGTTRSVVIATWHAILENCASLNDGGRFDISPRRVAAALVEAADLIERVFSGLEEVGLTEGNTVKAWAKRQFESDSSTERSRKHRNNKRNSDATLQQPDATPPETETEGETEKRRKKEERASARSADFAFAGTVVRLNVADFDRWQKAYSNIDLLAELTARDAWLASDGATDDDRKRWFVSTSKYLANRNMEARAKTVSREDQICPPEIYRGLQ